MADYIYSMKGLSKVHPPDKTVVSDVFLSFLPGAKIGVIGVNGTGKSSLLRIMAGVDTNYNGEAWLRPGASVGYFAQEPDLGDATTVKEAVDKAVERTRSLVQRFEDLSMKLGEPMSDDEMTALLEEQGKLQDQIDAVNAWELDRTIQVAMDALQLPEPGEEIAHLSGGEKRRVALCKVLLEQPDLLLLDEPTNHLDAQSVAWLEGHLERYPGTIVAVTHDRYFLDNVAEWILELDRGKAIPFEGNYTSWLEAKKARLDAEERVDQARQRKIATELEWVRSNPKGRHAKAKSRVQAFEALLNEQKTARHDPSEIRVAPGPRLGDLVIEVDGVSKAFEGERLYSDLSFRIPRGAIVGIVGPNGVGKTTLFRMIVGQEQPDEGEIRIGETVKLAYVDQSRDTLDGDKNVWEEISQGDEVIDFGNQQVASRQYVSWFNFKGSDHQKLVKNLSGGERNRVHLAKVLRSGGNVLMLDEPTNDLDVETLRSLEDALLDFPGCAIVISHDRWFLDRISSHILAFEGQGEVHWVEGGYEDYLADRKRRLGDNAALVNQRVRRRKMHA
ncbi:MAG TPA: energy-dependent translational throttle protein EttA [Polyangiaceae bacterium LLY-WYZ-14_1]|nr:energy-dependent translational throttle protein EttA [Polyangiaceae bacterium LLY-WYZ-14_1]